MRRSFAPPRGPYADIAGKRFVRIFFDCDVPPRDDWLRNQVVSRIYRQRTALPAAHSYSTGTAWPGCRENPLQVVLYGKFA